MHTVLDSPRLIEATIKFMSHFANAFRGLLARHKTDEWQISDRSGLSLDQLFRWRRSQDVLVLPRDLVRLARAFSTDKKGFIQAHAKLLHGTLMDQCYGPGAKLICLEVTPYPDWIITTSFGRKSFSPGLLNETNLRWIIWPWPKCSGVETGCLTIANLNGGFWIRARFCKKWLPYPSYGGRPNWSRTKFLCHIGHGKVDEGPVRMTSRGNKH
jgi:hypothetical protein